MVKAVKARRNSKAAAPAEFNRRDLWLAGLGAVSLGRRQGIRFYTRLRDEGCALQQRAGNVAGNLGDQLRSGVADARSRLVAIAQPVRSRAEAIIDVLTRQAQARLQAVLGRIGGRKPTARRAPVARKPAAKAGGKRAAPRKAAKTAKAAPRRAA